MIRHVMVFFFIQYLSTSGTYFWIHSFFSVYSLFMSSLSSHLTPDFVSLLILIVKPLSPGSPFLQTPYRQKDRCWIPALFLELLGAFLSSFPISPISYNSYRLPELVIQKRNDGIILHKLFIGLY